MFSATGTGKRPVRFDVACKVSSARHITTRSLCASRIHLRGALMRPRRALAAGDRPGNRSSKAGRLRGPSQSNTGKRHKTGRRNVTGVRTVRGNRARGVGRRAARRHGRSAKGAGSGTRTTRTVVRRGSDAPSEEASIGRRETVLFSHQLVFGYS